MAWTLTTLKQAIQDYVETDETTFVNNLDNIIRQAEDRILKNPSIQIPDFRKNVTGNCTADDQYLGIPADFLAPYSLAVDDGGGDGVDFLLFKNVNFIRTVYPNVSTTDTPKYYGIWDDEFFILGPTPAGNYAVELHYFHKPESITVSGDGTSWLGTHAESALLYACLVEAYIFLKGDADLMQEYKARMQEAMQEVGILSEGRNTTDEYRRGKP